MRDISSSKTNVNARLTYKRAIDQMQKPGTRLCQMHGPDGKRWFLLPGGPVSAEVASKIIAQSNVIGQPDALFPGMSQTWVVIPSTFANDFEAHGAQVIEKVRTEMPHVYLKIAADLLPREATLDVNVDVVHRAQSQLEAFRLLKDASRGEIEVLRSQVDEERIG
jgi:hypothetical protein